VGGKKERRHYKVETFPPEVREAVNRLLVQGATYLQVVQYLTEHGHEIGKSSLQRYGKDFLARYARIHLVREQALALMRSGVGSDGGLDMQDAASQLALHQIMETLLQMPVVLDEELNKIVNSLANLQRSDVMRERFKSVASKAIEAAKERLLADLKRELTQDTELYGRLVKIVERRVGEIAA